MLALDKKLFRDLFILRGQVLAIAMVVAGGTATLIMSLSTVNSLEQMKTAFYQSHRLADVYVQLVRAPNTALHSLSDITGVIRAESRIISEGQVHIPNYDKPVRSQILSVENGQILNQLYLRSGQLPKGGGRNEVVVSEPFAEAHHLSLGDVIEMTVRGRKVSLTISGIALSPEFIYPIQPGAFFPDYAHFGIFWMHRSAIESVSDMKGAFNSVIFEIESSASVKQIQYEIDLNLEQWGGVGAYSRANLVSNRFLSEEISQLSVMALIFPAVFMSVAAFLLNISMTRLLATQREQIALLKAFGYGSHSLYLHYVLMVLVIVLIGNILGIWLGYELGQGLTGLYLEYYRFPEMLFGIDIKHILIALSIGLLFGTAGTIKAVVAALSISPADAMRPPLPLRFKKGFWEQLALIKNSRPVSRMIVRNLTRKTWKSFLSVLGIASACAIMMVGTFQKDAVDKMVDDQYIHARKYDLMISFMDEQGLKELSELKHISGIQRVEGILSEAIDIRSGLVEHRTTLQGIQVDSRMQFVLNQDGERLSLVDTGLVINQHLATSLSVEAGDEIEIKFLQGKKGVFTLAITQIVNEYMGTGVYMNLDAMNALLGKAWRMNTALIQVDSDRYAKVLQYLDALPQVAAVSERQASIDNFYGTMAEVFLTFTFFNSILAAVIAIGVVYNNMRIAFSERSRELASLRVLGFKRKEVAWMLIGEQFFLTLLAIPIGLSLGYGLCWLLTQNLQTDLYRVPLVLTPSTYTIAAWSIIVASILAALLINRKIYQLDMIEVLKTRET